MDLTANMSHGKLQTLAFNIIMHLKEKSRVYGHKEYQETKTAQQGETTNTTHTHTPQQVLTFTI